jgi:hypothetical protein
VELWSISPNHNSTRACRKIIANMVKEAKNIIQKIGRFGNQFFVAEPEEKNLQV